MPDDVQERFAQRLRERSIGLGGRLRRKNILSEGLAQSHRE